MLVEIIGNGSVAQLLCRELTSSGNNVRLQVVQYNLNDVDRIKLVTSLRALPWLQHTDIYLRNSTADYSWLPKPDIKIFVGTIERFRQYQKSVFINSQTPILLLTSWWGKHDQLNKELPDFVLASYPKTTVESWHSRLVVLSQLDIELPIEVARSNPFFRDCARILESSGIRCTPRSMQNRFQTFFALTTFTYWYLIHYILPKQHGQPPVDKELVKTRWLNILPFIENEPDLGASLESVLFFINTIAKSNPEKNDAAWIINVLLSYKRGKIDYFLDRMHNLYC